MGIICQGALRVWCERDLSQKTKESMVTIADDFQGFCGHETINGRVVPDWWGLARSFVDCMQMFFKNNMSAKARKTHFG